MKEAVKEMTALNFLLEASRLPLGAQLYAIGKEENAEKGVSSVKKLMSEQKVNPIVIEENAEGIYKAVREFIKNTDFSPPGKLPKY